MAIETEIKLRVSPTGLSALQAHPLLELRAQGPWQERTLLNAYQDTPQADLARATVALRIRRDGDTLIQTLKTRGASLAGLSERNEWDWYLQQEQLAPELLDDSCWPAELAGLDKSQLGEIFRTDFVRFSRELAWQHEGQEVKVEVALDQGRVITASGEETICELELELREGPLPALLQLALALAQDIALMPCDISKAERGYRLLQPGSYALQLDYPPLTAQQPIETAFAQLAGQLLAASQRLAEQYRHTGQWNLLKAWAQQLVSLRALLASMGQLVPRRSSHGLRLALDALLQDWQQVLSDQDDRDQRDQAPALFAAELEQTRWGLFSLEMALWLHEQAWTTERSDKLSRQAATPLSRWLPRLLQQECKELVLDTYRIQPLSLGEQLPRLERVLVWLEAARHVLEFEAMDDLLGQLRLLRQAAYGRDVDNLQGSLSRVLSARGWKALLKARL